MNLTKIMDKLIFKSRSKWFYIPYFIIVAEVGSNEDLHLWGIFTYFQLGEFWDVKPRWEPEFSLQISFIFYWFRIRISFVPFFNTWSE